MVATLSIYDRAKACETAERKWHDAAHEVAQWTRTLIEAPHAEAVPEYLAHALRKYGAAWDAFQVARGNLTEQNR